MTPERGPWSDHLFSASAMRETDRRAIQEMGVPSMDLMERAGAEIARILRRRFPAPIPVRVLAGPGNNGGDGYIVARLLHRDGRDVVVERAGRRFSADHEEARRRYLEAGGRETEARTRSEEELWVDALFGTGLDRPLGGDWAALVEEVAAHPGPVLAVDVPSGLSGERPDPIGPHARAVLTVALGGLKPPHVFAPACDACGRVEVVDIGLPREAYRPDECVGRIAHREALAGLLPRRSAADHKGTLGRVLVVAGSPGFAGAAVLAGRGALRAGAGVVELAVPESVWPQVVPALPEAVTTPLPEGDPAPTLQRALERADALALGPGLGVDTPLAGCTARLYADFPGPAVVDADGLNRLAREGIPAEAVGPRVLTPHPGEFARLLGEERSRWWPARLERARDFARRHGVVLHLKGHPALTCPPDGSLPWLHTNGGPELAVPGSGDVLTGAAAALLARGLEPLQAAAAAAFAHAEAGRSARRARGGDAILAREIADHLPRALEMLAG